MNTSGKKKPLNYSVLCVWKGNSFYFSLCVSKRETHKKNDYSGTNGFLKLISEGILSGL